MLPIQNIPDPSYCIHFTGSLKGRHSEHQVRVAGWPGRKYDIYLWEKTANDREAYRLCYRKVKHHQQVNLTVNNTLLNGTLVVPKELAFNLSSAFI